MPVELIVPDGLANNGAWTGAHTDIDETGIADGNLVYTTTAGTQTVEITFPTPSANPLITVLGQQGQYAVTRTDSSGALSAGGSDPTYSIEVSSDDGATWQTRVATTTLTGTTAATNFNWTYPIDTGDPADGSQVRYRFTTTSNGGGPNRRWASIDFLRWNALVEDSGTTTPQTVAGSITPTGALSALSVIGQAVSGSITPTGALTSSLVSLQAAAGSLTPSGALSTVLNTSPVISGSTTQPSQVSSGYLLKEFPTTDAARASTSVFYSLDIDGLQIPLLQFTLRRDRGREQCYATFPPEYEDIALAASPGNFTISERLVYPSGPDDNNTIFTGTLSGTQTVSNGIQADLAGAATYPANASRELADVSYISDNGATNTVRSRIDSRFYPGDEAVYLDVQRLLAHHVVITVNRGFGFMEISSGY